MLGYTKIVQVVRPENVNEDVISNLTANKELCDAAGD